MLFNLGVVLSETERPEQATLCFEEFIEWMKPLENSPIQILQAETRLAALRLTLEEFETAEALARSVHDQWKRSAGELSAWTLSAQSILGRALAGLGRYPEAEELLLDRLAKLEQTQNPGSKRIRSAHEHLIELYDAWERPDRAAHFRALLEALPNS